MNWKAQTMILAACCTLVLGSSNLAAQTKATTEDGIQVILHDDDTWKYALSEDGREHTQTGAKTEDGIEVELQEDGTWTYAEIGAPPKEGEEETPRPRTGPFGLPMGASSDELERIIGSELVSIDMTPKKYFFALQRVPKPHSRFSTYSAQVLPRSGLCEIRAYTDVITTSRHGTHLKDQWYSVARAVSGNYGEYMRTDYDRLLEGSMWNEPEDWMMGLVKKERHLHAVWVLADGTEIRNDVEKIVLVAYASASQTDEGRLMLQYSFLNIDDCSDELQEGDADAF